MRAPLPPTPSSPSHHSPDRVTLSLYGQLAAYGAALTSVEMCLYELLGDCRDPAFREILALVR